MTTYSPGWLLTTGSIFLQTIQQTEAVLDGFLDDANSMAPSFISQFAVHQVYVAAVDSEDVPYLMLKVVFRARPARPAPGRRVIITIPRRAGSHRCLLEPAELGPWFMDAANSAQVTRAPEVADGQSRSTRFHKCPHDLGIKHPVLALTDSIKASENRQTLPFKPCAGDR